MLFNLLRNPHPRHLRSKPNQPLEMRQFQHRHHHQRLLHLRQGPFHRLNRILREFLMKEIHEQGSLSLLPLIHKSGAKLKIGVQVRRSRLLPRKNGQLKNRPSQGALFSRINSLTVQQGTMTITGRLRTKASDKTTCVVDLRKYHRRELRCLLASRPRNAEADLDLGLYRHAHHSTMHLLLHYQHLLRIGLRRQSEGKFEVKLLLCP